VIFRVHLQHSPSASRRNPSLKAQVWEGHDFQSCRKCQRMNAASSRWGSLWQPVRHWRDERAAQIVEFAVSLPLLLVFVVGIFDFSGAFTLKQKLTDAARDAARGAAADPVNDLSSFSPRTAPVSVIDAFQIVDNFLTANNINDCGIASATPTRAALTWTYSASGSTSGCPGTGLSITINRGYYFPVDSTAAASFNCAPQTPTGKTSVLATCVTISYAYAWRFDRVITLLGSRASLPGTITATAVAMNEN
jgi:Flp pilus assembly protein TadG